ncbi:MAG TPA: TIGR02452 family protein [Vicinamibacterales bacterium]|nr:TIGR02452 family protein [Vicinamibacterales bacterium]
MMSRLLVLPCLDSDEMAASRRRELDIPRDVAAELGRSAVKAAEDGFYVTRDGRTIDWRDAVEAARKAKRSIPPDAVLPRPAPRAFPETRVQVTNETTLGAARRLANAGHRPLALNFANGLQPGGGFLSGARAQEEVLCRSSALYHTLVGDRMYEEHRRRPQADSTDWAIYSPDVPVFRTDDGTELDEPWLLTFLTCAAPFAPAVGQPRAGDLLQKRIHRVLSIARAYEHDALVLGAWGCGAFGNDPHRTASDFRQALTGDFSAAFSDIVFAVVDWSPDRRFLGPFRDVFAPAPARKT